MTDKQIQQAVTDELAWTPEVTSSSIGVAAHNGVVTLSGHVPSLWQKRMAEEAAQKVKGVKADTQALERTKLLSAVPIGFGPISTPWQGMGSFRPYHGGP